MDSRTEWRRVNGVRGVERLMLTADQTPVRIRDADVQRIRDMENELGYVVVDQEEPPVFALMDQVRALTGAFRDQTGTFIEKASALRCRVLFSMLGRDFEYEMRERDLILA